jgi:hypothetical protein
LVHITEHRQSEGKLDIVDLLGYVLCVLCLSLLVRCAVEVKQLDFFQGGNQHRIAFPTKKEFKAVKIV